MTNIEKFESALTIFFCESDSEEDLEQRARHLLHCIETYDDKNFQEENQNKVTR